MNGKSTFHLRRFITFVLAGCGLVMTVSGVVLYAMPEGRITYWNNWRLFGLGKDHWGASHTIFSLAFLLAAVFHLGYNGRTLLHYLRDRIRRTLTLRRELVAAELIGVLLHGSIVGYAPFGQVVLLGKAAKKSWYADEQAKPPFAHAELMPLRQPTRKIDVDLQGAMAFLAEENLEADGDSTLKELTANGVRSPAQLFEAMMLDERLYR